MQWEAIPTTANASDYTPPGGTVTLLPGVTTLPIPLTITEDNEPEFTESLLIRLIGVTGGATLGPQTTATINILSNDDPNGALGKCKR